MTTPVAAEAGVRLSLDGVAQIKAELGSLKSELVKALNTNTKVQAISAIRDGFGMVKGAIGAANVVLVQFFGRIHKAAEEMSELQKIADRLGTDVKFISQIRVASMMSNMGINELEQSFAAFQRNLETFSQGVGESKKTFENLGITPDMLRNLGSLENQIFFIAERLSAIPDTSQRAGAAMRIFGEQGRKLIPLVNANGQALRAMLQMSDYLGVSFDENLGRKADYYRDSIRLLGVQLQGIWYDIANANLEDANKAMDNLIVSMKTFTDLNSNANLAGPWKFLTQAAADFGKLLLGIEIYTKRIQIGWLDLQSVIYNTDLSGNARADLADMIGAYEHFDATFRANMKEYQRLRNDSVSRVVKAGLIEAAEETDNAAEKLKTAAQMLAGAFKGEAIGRSASEMAKVNEINNTVFKDIRLTLKSIDNSLNGAPVLRTYR